MEELHFSDEFVASLAGVTQLENISCIGKYDATILLFVNRISGKDGVCITGSSVVFIIFS